MKFEDVFTIITAYDGDMQKFCTYLTEQLSDYGTKVSYGESSNDTDYNIELKRSGAVWPDGYDKWDRDTVNQFLEDGYLNMDYGYTVVLQWLCDRGIVPEGNYCLRVCW